MSDKSADQLMDELKSVSNDELKHRLETEFSFSCGPITASTRAVYLKKLIKLIEERNDANEGLIQDNHNHNNNGNNNAVSEESDTTARVSVIRSSPSRNRNSPRRPVDDDFPAVPTKTSTPKTRRQSSSAVSAHKKTTATKSRKTLAVLSEPTTGHSSSTPPPNTYSSSLNNYSSESSENEDKVDDKFLKTRTSPRKKMSSPAIARPLQEQLSSSQRVPFARPYPPSLTPIPNASKMSGISSLTRPPLRRSPGGQVSAQLANYSDSDDTEQEQNNDYIRDRLLRHRPGLSIGSFGNKGLQTSNGTAFEDTTSFTSSSNFISFAILVIVVLFFVFIFSFYFYTRISSSPKSAVDLTNFDFIREELVAPLCKTSDDFGSDNCLKYESDIMPALTIAKEMKSFIDKSILKFYCESDHKITSFSDLKSIDKLEIKKAIRNSIQVIKTGREGFRAEELDEVVFDRDFSNAVSLIQLNPNWQLKADFDTMGEVTGIAITDGYPLNLPFGCHLMITLKLNSYKIFSALLILFLTIGSVLYYKRSKKLATEEQDLVYDLVEKSLELIQSPDNPQSMPVVHIRDTLLSLSERKASKYKKIWNKVVKHIESTESRVKVDTENIEGDDYKTWKWVAANSVGNNDIQSNNGSTIIRTGSIEWQGQAFNNDHLNASQSVPNAQNGVATVKSSFAAPTPFLKIRNMFDSETKLSNPKEWRNKIRSAVLEKITIASKSGSHGVVHLEVEDSPEGLVYLKCNSIDSATDAFNGLHGWWCQKKLVSVKFLKSERYYARFPASAALNKSNLLPQSTQ